MDDPKGWMLFVAASALIAGAGQLSFTIVKGRVFYPWSRDQFEKDSCLFWLILAGSVGGILFGGMFVMLTLG